MGKTNKIVFLWYGIWSLLLFLYSYTQVDLSLTLSQASLFQTVEKAFQYVGFYQRPLSTGIYISILFGLIIGQLIALKKAKDGLMSASDFRMLILMIFFILVCSYPAFSYDLFNHMFSAKTVLIYHKNPYIVTPLQFSGVEPWLSFLHWTHVASVYSPLWIIMTIVPYLLGFGYFLLTLWNFKFFIGIFYLFASWGIWQALKEEKERERMFGTLLFALNPLVLIESLVSAHNDISMVAFAILAIVFFGKDRFYSFFFFSVSVAMKQVTIALLPIYLWYRSKALPFFLMVCMTGVFLYVTKREMMPWYALWSLPFIVFLPYRKYVLPMSLGISLGLLLRYAPFLYFGHWNDPVPLLKSWGTWTPIGIATVISIGIFLRDKKALMRK